MLMLTLFEYRTFYPKTKIAYKEYIEFPCSLSMFEEIHSNTRFIINDQNGTQVYTSDQILATSCM